jgi:short-chain fatty acids transporter
VERPVSFKEDSRSAALAATETRGVVATLVYMFEQVMPDPFVLSIGLTVLVVVLAVAFAPNGSIPTILNS